MSYKAPLKDMLFDIRHLAIFIDTQADAADEELTNTQLQPDDR